MASVWRAVHREQGVPSAVKVLGARSTPSLAEALRQEIRAMARLEHPHIVGVFDQGTVDADAAALSGGRLAEGSPWVALEFVDGQTLGQLYRTLDWLTLATILTQLLDALAHAHAAGVIHRDLKLSNVLYGPHGVKLMDFGIAYALQQHEDALLDQPIHAGTPRYMPPEQLNERVEDQGPWTDLFALGVLAWRLASHTSPFPEDLSRSRQAKVRGHFETFIPRFALPSGFPGWCARLLCPRPADRFASAPEAAHALLEVIDRTMDATPDEPIELVLPPTDPLPFPRTWRSPHAWRRPVELVGCGLRLFGLRDARFTGRVGVRDRLWAHLEQVHTHRYSRTAVLRGPSGYGKTSLATWLGRRAMEVGVARMFRARWTDEVQPGLPGLVARHLRCLGQPLAVVRSRVEGHLGRRAEPGEARRLLQLLCPGELEDGEEALSTEERYQVVTRTLARLTGGGTAVLLFDDAHVNPEAFHYAAWLQQHPEDHPFLVLLTVQEEGLATRTASNIALQELVAQRRTRTYTIGPLAMEDQMAVIQGLLRLEPALTERIARRTEGNPLFARQLLDDWVGRDLLELSVDGFRLRNALEARLPDSLAEVWHARVEGLLSGCPEHRIPLELAAVLGSVVDDREWVLVCQARGFDAPDALRATLQRLHLANAEAEGWSFIHGMLREAILQSAKNAGRLDQHHRTVAHAIARSGGAAVRIGKHLLMGQAGVEAIDPLEMGAEEATRSGDYEEALRLLRARATLMRQVRFPPHDQRWGRGWVLFAELLARLDRWEEAAEYAEQARAEAREHGWGRVEVEALMLLVENRSVTDLPRARDLLERAYEVANTPGNEDTLAPVCLLAAEVHRRSGDLVGSLLFGRRSLAHVLRSGGLRRSRCEIAIAQTLIKLDQLEDAARHVDRAEALADRQGHPFDRAVCAYLRASIGRQSGDLDAAERAYREATDRFAALGDGNAWSMRAHLGIVLAERGAIDEARTMFQLVLRTRSQLGDLLAHLGSLLCTADEPDPRGFGNHVRAVERFVQRGWCDPLAARIVERAAGRASRAGYPQRARVLLGLSYRQRERLSCRGS
jgi:tetratricopeptide (TPR) repeat protein